MHQERQLRAMYPSKSGDAVDDAEQNVVAEELFDEDVVHHEYVRSAKYGKILRVPRKRPEADSPATGGHPESTASKSPSKAKTKPAKPPVKSNPPVAFKAVKPPPPKPPVARSSRPAVVQETDLEDSDDDPARNTSPQAQSDEDEDVTAIMSAASKRSDQNEPDEDDPPAVRKTVAMPKRKAPIRKPSTAPPVAGGSRSSKQVPRAFPMDDPNVTVFVKDTQPAAPDPPSPISSVEETDADQEESSVVDPDDDAATPSGAVDDIEMTSQERADALAKTQVQSPFKPRDLPKPPASVSLNREPIEITSDEEDADEVIQSATRNDAEQSVRSPEPRTRSRTRAQNVPGDQGNVSRFPIFISLCSSFPTKSSSRRFRTI